MITLYQESVPFTNKRLDKEISSNGLYTNPVIMPYAFDTTGGINVFESVVYIRNNDQSKYYTNVVISLMKEDPNITDPTTSSAIINSTNVMQLNSNYISIGRAFGDSQSGPGGTNGPGGIQLLNTYMSNYIPVSNDGILEVKFSYEYDEQSNYNWSSKQPGLLIPYIGNSSMADMSYIPVRMRVELLAEPTAFTLRDYFIDVSYESEIDVVGV